MLFLALEKTRQLLSARELRIPAIRFAAAGQGEIRPFFTNGGQVKETE